MAQNEFITHAFDNLIEITIEHFILKYAQEVEESLGNYSKSIIEILDNGSSDFISN